jgi:hypothetical protein
VANEYASLDDLKARLQITDSTHDAELQSKLTTASRDIDQDCNRRFYLDAAASQRIYNPLNRQYPTPQGMKLLIDDIGDVAGLLVEVGTSSTGWAAITTYETGPDNAIAKGSPVSWLLRTYIPWVFYPLQRVRVTAIWGWPAVPPQIFEACLIRAARLFKRRDSPDGIAGAGDFGVIRVGRYDPDYDSLIRPFVIPGIGGAL